jgi:hypothetical protein
MSKRKPLESPGPSDFVDADLGDKRRTARLRRVSEVLSRGPEKSFPQMFPSSADLEGAYRFLSNPLVDPRAILAAQGKKAAERVSFAGVALLLSDTTELTYSGLTREGLGTLTNCQQFFAHCALAISADGLRRPYGVVAARTWVREKPRKWTKAERKSKEYHLRAGKESRRWWEVAQEAEALAPPGSLIHVMDREADSYEVFWKLIESEDRFVIRSGARERRVRQWLKGPVHELQRVLSKAKRFLTAEVPISRRKGSSLPGTAQIHPPRDARVAKLEYSAMRAVLEKPRQSPHLREAPKQLELNLVYVRELAAPVGCEPVEWILATTEPIDTTEQVAQVIGYYRARWTIEEFFKAVKTGCAMEKRQLESYDGLCRALMISLPVACQLLDLRALSRSEPKRQATDVVTQDQLDILRVWSPRRLPKRPTVRDALLAVAGLGGHIVNNGDPGWMTLARGLSRLDDAVEIVTRTRLPTTRAP